MSREIAETREEGYFIAGIGTGIKIVWTAFRFIPLPLYPFTPLPLYPFWGDTGGRPPEFVEAVV